MSRILEVAIDGGPYALAPGPDGALWVTLGHAGAIARIGVDGVADVHPVAAAARPSLITAGPDGALWFTRSGDDRIGRITSDGKQASYELPSGRLEPAGGVTLRQLPTPNAGAVGIASTHDDTVWFTELRAERLGRIPMD